MTASGTNAETRFHKVSQLFEQIRARPPVEREASLDALGAQDPELAVEVRSLLAYHDVQGDTIDRGVLRPGVGAVVGNYRIDGVLGEGGMGTVYRATQTAPVQREVALKVIKLGMDTRAVVRRFAAERQSLARLEHVNVARVLDAGATADGRPYFVMELVRGVPITAHCDAEHLDWRERIRLFLHVCAAVQHAHQRGILHRDLKPSNLLVADIDGLAVPKVIDFGVAKALERGDDPSRSTTCGQVVGTPDYMSPEQTRGDDVDTRTDVYALGVVLYELLVGATPGQVHSAVRATRRSTGATPPETGDRRRRSADDEAVRPSSAVATARGGDVTRQVQSQAMRRVLRGDLDWIILKALAREPERRFESVSAFAEDLERFLRHDPVAARPPSIAYLAAKFARRHTVALTAMIAVLMSLLIGVAVSLYGLRVAQFERDIARDAEREQSRLADVLSDQLFASNVERGRQSVRYGHWAESHDLLWGAHLAQPESVQARWALREMVWTQGCVASLQLHATVNTVRFLPDGERVFTCGSSGQPVLFNVTTGESTVLPGPASGAWEVDVTRDGRHGITCDGQGTVMVWDLCGSEAPRLLRQGAAGRTFVECSETEDVVFIGGSDGAVWRIRLDNAEPPRVIGVGASMMRLETAPDGTIAAGGADGSVLLMRPDGDAQRTTWPHTRPIQGLGFGQGGRLLATGTTAQEIVITDTVTGEVLQTFSPRLGTVRDIAFGPDDRTLLILGWWGISELDRASGTVRMLLPLSGWRFDRTVAGDMLAVAGRESRAIMVWRLGPEAASLRGVAPARASARAFGSSAAAFIASTTSGIQKLDERGRPTGFVGSVAAPLARVIVPSPSRALVATVASDGRLRVERTDDGSLIAEAPNVRTAESAVVAFHRDDLCAFVTRANGVDALDLRTGEICEVMLPFGLELLALAFSPDGQTLAVAARQGEIHIVDLQSGAKLKEIGSSTSFAAAFSSDGTSAMFGTWRGDVLVRDMQHGVTTPLRGHSAMVRQLVAHPQDPDLVLSASNDGTVRLWHLTLRREVLSLSPFGGPSTLRDVGFLDNGERIAAVSIDGELATYSIPDADRRIDRMRDAERSRFQQFAAPESDAPQ